jgi:hypothetical protein
VSIRVALGRTQVAREVRAATPLMAALKAPPTAQAPWLTAVLNTDVAEAHGARPVAVVLDPAAGGPPDAAAFLALRRRGLRTAVTLLGDGRAPVPPGRPTARLLARDDDAAVRLAAGIEEFLLSLRGPWTLRLAGLPLGDPTVRALAPRLPTCVVANERTLRLVDELDGVGEVVRGLEPRALESALPALLRRAPGPPARLFVRCAARLQAAIGALEVAVVPGDGEPRAALLTLVDGADRWPWWGFSDVGGLRHERGSPAVSLTVPRRGWP